MRSRVQDASELFQAGYNCCQAVFATYADIYGVDRETALKLSSSMGAGVGRMREICGTVTAMAMLEGLKEGNTDAHNEIGKTRVYQKVREMSDEFRRQNGSIVCRELLGRQAREDSAKPDERTSQYYQNRPCGRLVIAAAKLVEEQLMEDMFD